jgi:hypothetical protein
VTAVDVRSVIRANVEATAAAHQPDGFGHCTTCDPPEAYPCGPLWAAQHALDAFDHRGVSAAPVAVKEGGNDE